MLILVGYDAYSFISLQFNCLNVFLEATEFQPFVLIGIDDKEDDDIDSDEEELEMCKDPDYIFYDEPDTSKEFKADQYYSVEMKRKILAFWRSGKKLKTIEQMQHNYSHLIDIRILYRWDEQLSDGNRSFGLIHLFFHELIE